MSDSPAGPELKVETERRIGRNVILFQRIELVVKLLLVLGRIEFRPREAEDPVAKRFGEVGQRSLGQLSEQLFSEVLLSTPNADKEVIPRPADAYRIRSVIQPPPDYPQAILDLQTEFNQLVLERNQLVHNFLQRVREDFEGDLTIACSDLDAQHVRAQVIFDHLKALHDQMVAHRQGLSAYLSSDEGSRAFDLALLKCSIVDQLVEISAANERPDGWTYLTTAEQRVAKEQIQELQSALGRRPLRKLLEEAGEVFEVLDEPLEQGTRVVYRVRAR